MNLAPRTLPLHVARLLGPNIPYHLLLLLLLVVVVLVVVVLVVVVVVVEVVVVVVVRSVLPEQQQPSNRPLNKTTKQELHETSPCRLLGIVSFSAPYFDELLLGMAAPQSQALGGKTSCSDRPRGGFDVWSPRWVTPQIRGAESSKDVGVRIGPRSSAKDSVTKDSRARARVEGRKPSQNPFRSKITR